MERNKYYQSKSFLKLLHRYEEAVSEGHVPYLEADELTDIAEYYMTGRQDAKANQAIQAAIDMHPSSVDPQIFLARQKLFYGKLDEARSILEAITEQDDCEVIYIHAELLIKEGHPQEATAFLLEKMELMQDCLDTYLHDCISIFMDYDKWEEAKEWLERLRESFPNHPKLPIMEAEIQMGLDDYESALAALQKIVEKDPYNSEAWNLLSETYGALDRNAEALEAADYALAINPEDSDALLMKANSYMHDDQVDEAIECFTKYLDAQPDDLSAMISMIICYSTSTRFEEVLTLTEKAEQLALKLPDRKDDLTQIYQLRAMAFGYCHKTSEGLATIEKARRYCEKSEQWRLDLSIADIYLQNNKPKTAERYYLQVMKDTSEQCETLFHIALSYCTAGLYDTAINLLNDVWSMLGSQEGRFVVPYIAHCYYRKNDMDNFLQYLQVAPYCDRVTTQNIFRDIFPDMPPEDFYAYAYKEVHGVFPPDNLTLQT